MKIFAEMLGMLGEGDFQITFERRASGYFAMAERQGVFKLSLEPLLNVHQPEITNGVKHKLVLATPRHTSSDIVTLGQSALRTQIATDFGLTQIMTSPLVRFMQQLMLSYAPQLNRAIFEHKAKTLRVVSYHDFPNAKIAVQCVALAFSNEAINLTFMDINSPNGRNTMKTDKFSTSNMLGGVASVRKHTAEYMESATHTYQQGGQTMHQANQAQEATARKGVLGGIKNFFTKPREYDEVDTYMYTGTLPSDSKNRNNFK